MNTNNQNTCIILVEISSEIREEICHNYETHIYI